MTTHRLPSKPHRARPAVQHTGFVAALAILGVLAPGAPAAAAPEGAAVPFKEARMLIEYNSTAEDIGVQFFLDSDGWETVEILAPDGQRLFEAGAEARLFDQGGGTELFVESVEPELADLPIPEFLARFPEGPYRFFGFSPEGDPLESVDQFTHKIPRGPRIVYPETDGEECGENVPIPFSIKWSGVQSSIFGTPVTIAGYQVIVERSGRHFDITLPASARSVQVPRQFLRPNSDYIFEILAIEQSGNQTISEGCFRTAR